MQVILVSMYVTECVITFHVKNKKIRIVRVREQCERYPEDNV
jgi:hypothetical protein